MPESEANWNVAVSDWFFTAWLTRLFGRREKGVGCVGVVGGHRGEGVVRRWVR